MLLLQQLLLLLVVVELDLAELLTRYPQNLHGLRQLGALLTLELLHRLLVLNVQFVELCQLKLEVYLRPDLTSASASNPGGAGCEPGQVLKLGVLVHELLLLELRLLRLSLLQLLLLQLAELLKVQLELRGRRGIPRFGMRLAQGLLNLCLKQTALPRAAAALCHRQLLLKLFRLQDMLRLLLKLLKLLEVLRGLAHLTLLLQLALQLLEQVAVRLLRLLQVAQARVLHLLQLLQLLQLQQLSSATLHLLLVLEELLLEERLLLLLLQLLQLRLLLRGEELLTLVLLRMVARVLTGPVFALTERRRHALLVARVRGRCHRQ